VVVTAFYGAITVALLATHSWDPRFFATVGPEWQRHDPTFAKQADGMIFLDWAVDPVAAAARHERRRTIRILYPLTAHVLAAGRADLVAWPLLLINPGAIALGTEVLHRCSRSWIFLRGRRSDTAAGTESASVFSMTRRSRSPTSGRSPPSRS
jgi:hypothetical protein